MTTRYALSYEREDLPPAEAPLASEKPTGRIRSLQQHADPENLLARYFQEVSTFPVIQPEEEFNLSQRIENLEIALWTQVLSHPYLLEHILDMIDQAHHIQIPTMARLKKNAATLRNRSTATKRKRYSALCELVAKEIRAFDVDRELIDQVLKNIRLISCGKLNRFGRKKISVRANSKSFKEYSKRVTVLDLASRHARDEFVQANLRLVVTIANRFNFGQLPLHDLIQEGNIGLIKAIGRFDHRRGFRFSTYASWWIRHAITRAIADKGRTIRIPVHLQSTHKKIARIRQELGLKLNRSPTNEEIGASASIPTNRIEEINEQLHRNSVSLDDPISMDDNRRLLDMIQDPNGKSPDEPFGNHELYHYVLKSLVELSPIESDIIRRRFGLADGRTQTLREIGQGYHLSRERIRQIQDQALKKIRRFLVRQKAI